MSAKLDRVSHPLVMMVDMSLCHDCNQDMKTADGCVIDELTLNGVTYARAPFGREPGWPSTDARCGDCGATSGSHHHLGCDIARCPACDWQMISCGCDFDEYGQTWLHENQLALQF